MAALVGLCTRPPNVSRGKLEIPYATIVAIMLFTIAASYIAYLFMSNNLTTTLARLTKLQDEADQSTSINGINRWDLWKAAYHYWLTAPLVGHGLNSFAVMYVGHDLDGLHPHDIFLEMLSEMGLVGLILFLIFMWVGARNASFARLKRDPLMVCVLLYVITSAMSALFGRDIVGVRKFFFAISLLALRPPTNAPDPADAERYAEDEERRRLAQREARPGRRPALAAAGASQTARGV